MVSGVILAACVGSTAQSEFGASRKTRAEFFNRSTSILIAAARIALEPSKRHCQ
jgi:hypothetical protein